MLVVKNLTANEGDLRGAGSILGLGWSLEEGMATHSSILTWRIPWTEEPGRLPSIGLQTVRHDWNDLAHSWLTSELHNLGSPLEEYFSITSKTINHQNLTRITQNFNVLEWSLGWPRLAESMLVIEPNERSVQSMMFWSFKTLIQTSSPHLVLWTLDGNVEPRGFWV